MGPRSQGQCGYHWSRSKIKVFCNGIYCFSWTPLPLRPPDQSSKSCCGEKSTRSPSSPLGPRFLLARSHALVSSSTGNVSIPSQLTKGSATYHHPPCFPAFHQARHKICPVTLGRFPEGRMRVLGVREARAERRGPSPLWGGASRDTWRGLTVYTRRGQSPRPQSVRR